MNVIKKLIFTLGIILSFTNTLLGTEVFAAHYKNDITPPWGRVYVEKSAKVDGTTYVGETPVSVKIYAKDDMCKDEEIKYYISTEPISSTTKLKTWYDYEPGKAHEISLSDDGTGKVYTVFKDANGNTSLTYEANVNTAQKIIFNTNGGIGKPTGVDNNRIYGMPYIIPNQAPEKEGGYFLGWSTDKEATIGSYRPGDAIPPDASLGTEERITLYAIYGNNLDTFPDLVDVVEIGDYVNYPVFYDNQETWVWGDGVVSAGHLPKLNGWRVLSKDEDSGTINLISAGVPLTLYKVATSTAKTVAANMKSVSNFLKISFTTGATDGCFRTNGFEIYNTLLEAFTNKYTVMNDEIPQVRSITKADFDSVYKELGETTATTSYGTYVKDKKYRDMLAIPSTTGKYSYYWLADTRSDVCLMDICGAERTFKYI